MPKVTSSRRERATVVEHLRVSQRYYKLVLSWPAAAATRCQPGQFVSVRVHQGMQPLLRRPFGIHRVDRGRVALLYEVVGEGTRLLAGMRPGDIVDCIGPLGNGFTLPCRQTPGVVLVAGGMGVAPLLFLAQRMARETAPKEAGKPAAHSAPVVLIGAKTKKALLCAQEFKAFGFQVHRATDDGSSGFHGRVSDLLEQFLAASVLPSPTVYACGPHPMLRAVAGTCRARAIPCEVSLEEHMACGFGACLGCVIQTTQGYRRVCKEGPVFTAADVVWDAPAAGGDA